MYATLLIALTFSVQSPPPALIERGDVSGVRELMDQHGPSIAIDIGRAAVQVRACGGLYFAPIPVDRALVEAIAD